MTIQRSPLFSYKSFLRYIGLFIVRTIR